ncbi:hypothetical protein MHK_009670 [Candidatus Magnetomorum sp. HK-1]|nr:hypothetical protein MHK_009670 [Candidatus Magnetomorum sp. HK-1]
MSTKSKKRKKKLKSISKNVPKEKKESNGSSPNSESGDNPLGKSAITVSGGFISSTLYLKDILEYTPKIFQWIKKHWIISITIVCLLTSIVLWNQFQDHQEIDIQIAFQYLWAGYPELAENKFKGIKFNSDIVSSGLAKSCFYQNASDNCFQQVKAIGTIWQDLMVANQHFLAGNFDSAKIKYKEIQNKDIQDEIALYECHLGQQQCSFWQATSNFELDKVQSKLQELLDWEPDCVIAHMLIGRIYAENLMLTKAKNQFLIANHYIENKSSSISMNRLYQINTCFIQYIKEVERCMMSSKCTIDNEKKVQLLYEQSNHNKSQKASYPNKFLLITLRQDGKILPWVNIDYYISRMLEKRLDSMDNIQAVDPLLVHEYYRRKNSSSRFFIDSKLIKMAEILDVSYLLTGTIKRVNDDLNQSLLKITIIIHPIKQGDKDKIHVTLPIRSPIEQIVDKCGMAIKEKILPLSQNL